MFAACSSSGDDRREAAVYPHRAQCEPEGGELSLRIATKFKWEIDGRYDWCRLSAYSGTGEMKITVSVDPYETTDERVAAFDIRVGDTRLEAKVVQAGSGFVVTLGDASFSDYCLENFDLDGNGKLTADEAAQVEMIELWMTYPGAPVIRSLAGLEYFTGLTYLDCVDCRALTQVDVTSNRNLEYLSFFGSRLTSLDLSCNPRLDYLNVSWNPLETLNLSANPELRYLSCVKTQVTDMDLTANNKLYEARFSGSKLKNVKFGEGTAIEMFYCDSCQVSGLDVSACTNLKTLDCTGNTMQELDVARNTKLVALICDGNRLSALDVSHNPVLNSLTCSKNKLTSLSVAQNPVLRNLVCGDNLFATLDVSANTGLRILDIDKSEIKQIDISKCTQLEIFFASEDVKLQTVYVWPGFNLDDMRGYKVKAGVVFTEK